MTISIFALAAAAAAQAAAPQAVANGGGATPVQSVTTVPAVVATPGYTSVQANQPAPLVIQETPRIETGNVLKQGTPIHLATEADLTSQENRVGDRVELRVMDAVSLNGHTVIPVGTRGVGEVTLVRKKGMWGKSGRLEFRPLYLSLGGREVPISTRVTTKEHGETGTAGVVASIVVLPLAGFFVTGTSAKIPRGSFVDAELSEDLPVVFK